jgi:hypothetical protein
MPSLTFGLHSGPLKQDLKPFACLFTMNLQHPAEQICRQLFKRGIIPALQIGFNVIPSRCKLYSQWHDFCRTLTLQKIQALDDPPYHTILLTANEMGVRLMLYPVGNEYKPQLNYCISNCYYYITHYLYSLIAWAATASSHCNASANTIKSHGPH